ncbi:MAG: hypothetical protein IPP76_14200 [Moraxellaceae bacterium]|nr:hypothetical protein [Moraxellaceae bacterium]
MNEFIQSGIVYLVIVWSVWVTLRRYAPSLIHVPQQHLATWLSHQGFTKAGQYFTPQPNSGGCDSGCGSCKTGCATPVEQVQVVKWRK